MRKEEKAPKESYTIIGGFFRLFPQVQVTEPGTPWLSPVPPSESWCRWTWTGPRSLQRSWKWLLPPLASWQFGPGRSWHWCGGPWKTEANWNCRQRKWDDWRQISMSVLPYVTCSTHNCSIGQRDHHLHGEAVLLQVQSGLFAQRQVLLISLLE